MLILGRESRIVLVLLPLLSTVKRVITLYIQTLRLEPHIRVRLLTREARLVLPVVWAHHLGVHFSFIYLLGLLYKQVKE